MTKKWIEIDLTLECNWCCPCCVRLCNLKQKNPKSIMSLNDITHICEEINDVGCKKFEHITLIGGEPTINPNFLDICLYIKNTVDTKIEVSSNSSNNQKYKKILSDNNIKFYTFGNKDTPQKKLESHFNFYLSPTENSQILRDDCGLNCGINISKVDNEILYSFCGNQKYLSILLNKKELCKKCLNDIMNCDCKNDPLTMSVCKHCQFMAKDRIRWKDNKNISNCFKDGIKNYTN